IFFLDSVFNSFDFLLALSKCSYVFFRASLIISSD
ncbi:hypothetical protein EC950943_5035B, partial [Escherichia coli 95.0943]